jgi:hypothetical protein
VQSYGGDSQNNTTYPISSALTVNWAVPTNLFPGGRTQPVTVPLIPPGAKYLDRWTQVDLSFKKLLTFGRQRFEASLDMFNALNSNVILVQNQAFGPTLDQPQQILQPRLLRVSGQWKF